MPRNAGKPSTSFRPFTPVRLIDLELKSASPRATDACAGVCADVAHAENRVIAGPAGSTVGGTLVESIVRSLMPTKNGCANSSTGPLVAPLTISAPAEKSKTCAVDKPVSKIDDCLPLNVGQIATRLRMTARGTIGLVAQVDLSAARFWCAESVTSSFWSVSLPSHITSINKSQIRAGQRPPEKRQLGGTSVTIGVVNGYQVEFRIRRRACRLESLPD